MRRGGLAAGTRVSAGISRGPGANLNRGRWNAKAGVNVAKWWSELGRCRGGTVASTVAIKGSGHAE
jgi:hypothetical protein